MPRGRQTEGTKYLLLPLLSLLVAVVLRLFVFDIYRVETSPIPKYIPHHSWVMVYRLSSPHVGDLILLNPENKKSGIATSYEVVATQGDTVECHGGRLYVNGVYLAQISEDRDYKLSLNVDEFFVLAPELSEDLDSRHVGLVRRKDIIGRIALHLSL